MKTKKLIVTLLISVATIMLFALVNQTYASTSGIGKVNITAERTVNMPVQNTTQTYKVKHQLFSTDGGRKMNVWKLIGKNQEQSSTDKLKDLYCIRAGLGFANTTGGEEFSASDVDYTVGYELPKEFSNAKQFFEKDGHSDVPVLTDAKKDDFNKMMWILDHMLLEDASDVEAREYLVKHAGYTTSSFSESSLRENVLTRADIEVIQQLAIWYYTNAEEDVYNSELYQGKTLQALSLCIGEDNIYNTQGAYRTLVDIYDSGTSITCNHPCGTERQEAANKLFTYLIEGYEKEKGAESLNEAGLYVPTREIIVYVAGDNTEQQPVVQVKETAEADISLRKFIYSVNGNKLEGNSSREPVVDTSKLNTYQEGVKITTADYNHPKTPVRVNIGDIITYTIRLYNEGEVDAIIKKVKDTLPEYIQFEDPDENGYWLSANNTEVETTEECKIVGAGGQLKFNEIVNKKLSEVVIPAAKLNEDPTDPSQKYTLSYVDIQISGKVMTTAPYDTKLTNIAEVTEMTDKAGTKDLNDRDSKVTDENGEKNGNAKIPVENEKPKYKEDKENDKYVPGQEDDDDFEKVIVEAPTIDLALRKFISKVGNKTYNRAPVPDTTGLRDGTSTTAVYNHSKVPVRVKKGDIVTYTIRIYNEGEVAGKVKEVTDYIAKNLSYVAGGTDTNADWWKETDGTEYKTVVSTEKCLIVNVGGKVVPTCVGKPLGEAIIPAYDKEKDVLSYVDIEIHCKVLDEVLSGTKLTNIAEITKEADEYDKLVEQDKDSKPDNVKEDEQKPDKFPDTKEEFPHFKEDKENDKYVPGQEDDDDFEKLYIEEPIDLALRKYISKIGDTEYEREPVVDTTPLLEAIENGTIEDEGATAIYKHSKDPIKAKVGDIVTYKLRIYNEGLVDGRVSEITDHVDKNLRYIAGGRDENKTWWQEEEGEEYNTITSTDSCVVTAVGGNTSIADLGKHPKDVVIPAFDPDTNVISYIEVEINLQIQKVTEKIKLTNIAEITKEADETGRKVEQDIDSIPDNVEQKEEFPNEKEEWPHHKEDEENKGPEGYVPGNEDDDDFEKVEVVPKFDLALRKFITKVQNTPVNNRYPRVTYSEDEDKLTYTHTKTPVEVVTGDIVTYTIRIYNEGEQDGYANEITDDVPEELEFLLGNETNIKYRWKMLDEKGEETEDPSKAKYIVTDYLSEEQEKETKRDNKLKAFDKELAITETNPDYRDVQVAFKVTYVAKTKDESERVLVNVAQISEDSDDDDDSIPNRDEEYKKDGDNEDDIDYDNVKVKYFDLSLLKWVAQTKVTLNGKETVTDTGHNAQNSKNEPPVKLEINSKDINKVVIKYVYTIQITNEGEIEGYATEITDYIPEGLRFEEADNKEWNWKVKSDGVVTTDYLKDTLLKPGESATVPIVLTWINSAENLGEKVNLAEVSADDNPSDSPDVDSTPDNKVPEEDDIDDAPVVLATKTGAVQIYIGLISIILITFASGISLIKKYVLE